MIKSHSAAAIHGSPSPCSLISGQFVGVVPHSIDTVVPRLGRTPCSGRVASGAVWWGNFNFLGTPARVIGKRIRFGDVQHTSPSPPAFAVVHSPVVKYS